MFIWASYGHKNAANGTEGQCWDGWADWGNGAWTGCCKSQATSGSANTGNNGGATTNLCKSAGSGGSGIAIIRNSQ